MSRTAFLTLLLIAIVASTPATALTVNESQKLFAVDGVARDYFGYAVAISGDIAVVGAFADDLDLRDAGAVYVFDRVDGDWVQQATLRPDDPVQDHYFGWSVAVDGETIVVGAPGDRWLSWDTGSAYVFTRSHDLWIQEAKLIAADAQPRAEFGSSVAISGDTVLIGTPLAHVFEPELMTNQGAVYAFSRSAGEWTQQAKLLASDGTRGDEFGTSVAMEGDTAVIGAPLDDAPHASGSAYVFSRSTGVWEQQAKLRATFPVEQDFFGDSVSLSGDTVIVGAPFLHGMKSDTGSAYVFTKSQGVWARKAKLVPSDADLRANFGCSVAISGDTAVIGARFDDNFRYDTGSAYAFTRSSDVWTEQAKLLSSYLPEHSELGQSVALDGDTAVVGAPGLFAGALYSGSAYVYTVGEYRTIVLDVKPGGSQNPINPDSYGVIPVAIMGSQDFDVTSVDRASLRFGPRFAQTAHNLTESFTYDDHLEDLNLDGFTDLMTHYRVREVGITCRDESLTLIAMTVDRQLLVGTDSITTRPCRWFRSPAIWMLNEEPDARSRQDGPVNIDRK